MHENPMVYVVDDDRDLRRSIQWMLDEAGYDVETFESADRFLETYDSGRCGCILLDIHMPGTDGITLQRQLIERQEPLCVIIISAYSEIDHVVSAMRDGALDFLQKPFKREALIDRIEQGLEQAERMRQEFAQRDAIYARLETLTPRENEVLMNVVRGLSTKEIAYKWSISSRTVELHRSRILQKMRADSAVHLVRMCMIAGVGDRDSVETRQSA